ncbi:MAG: anthranilate phosphoribosyltransferase [Myxococcota bacterium]
MKDILESLCRHEDLPEDTAHRVFSRVIDGQLSEIEIASLVTALKAKGETPDEVAGAARALREAAADFPAPPYACADTCGTGGDGMQTVNISTAVALVAAEMGIPIVKHGNRSVSSKCGSADVLEKVGVNLEASAEVARRCLDEANICFLFAPHYHAGVRHAMPVRRALATRTIFNLLGPLVNPAAPKFQVMGVYDPKLCKPAAETLGLLGCESALVVHGSGLDEIALHGSTHAARLVDGRVHELEITPDQAGLSEYPLDALRGGEPEENARWFRRVLAGDGNDAHNAAISINAGALAMVTGRADTLADGVEMALEALKSGRADSRLSRFAEVSHGA